MIILILGVLLWSGAHLFKRLAPDTRANLGDKGKGLVALLSVLAIVLMVIGYRDANGAVVWGRTSATTGINNLLMIFALYLFVISGTSLKLAQKIKNPQLTGVKVWAFAHLLVNGDIESFILFGGLTAWAVVTVIMLKKAGPAENTAHKDYTGPITSEARAVLATAVLTAVVMGAHAFFGAIPWG